MTKSSFWKALRTSISILLAVFLVAWVVHSSGLDVRQVWSSIDRRFLMLAFLFYAVGFFLASCRWYVLLQHIDVKLSLATVIRLGFIGQFFNLFVPGGVGGDLIKMVYLKRDSGERYPEAVLSVLLDRILGLMGLLLLALGAVALQPQLLSDSAPQMRAILFVVALAGGAGLVGAVLFVLWPYLGKLASRLEALLSSLPVGLSRILQRLAEAVSLVRSGPITVMLLMILAMMGHFFAGLAIFAIGYGVGGVEAVSFQEFLLSTQLANLVGAVPLTPGGLGGRDLTLAYLLTLCGASETSTGAIPLVVTSLIILWSCLGGLALLWEKKESPALATPGEDEA